MEAIEAYHPAIEIVDDRYVKWETMGAPTLVADDFFAAGCVLGKAVARTEAPDLLMVAGRAVINGKEAGRGTGADVLGHPHNALAWLANHLADEGKGLHAGPDRADRKPGEDRVAQGRRQRGDGARRARHGGGRFSGLSEIVQGQESVPSVLEADARGEIAEIYADIRKVLGTSVVNLIWRNLATMPGALQWTWSTVRPLYLGDAPLHAEAVRRTIALPDWPGFLRRHAARRRHRRVRTGASSATCSTAINTPTRWRSSCCRRCWRITNRGRPMP